MIAVLELFGVGRHDIAQAAAVTQGMHDHRRCLQLRATYCVSSTTKGDTEAEHFTQSDGRLRRASGCMSPPLLYSKRVDSAISEQNFPKKNVIPEHIRISVREWTLRDRENE